MESFICLDEEARRVMNSQVPSAMEQQAKIEELRNRIEELAQSRAKILSQRNEAMRRIKELEAALQRIAVCKNNPDPFCYLPTIAEEALKKGQ